MQGRTGACRQSWQRRHCASSHGRDNIDEIAAEISKLRAQLCELEHRYTSMLNSKVDDDIGPDWHAIASRPQTTEHFNILSLDGGGVRGLFTAVVLARLVEKEPDMVRCPV